MPNEINPKTQLLQEALNSYEKEYHELCETWRHLEDKAQGTITISGIFLAALFTFVSGLIDTIGLFDLYYEKGLLIAAAILLTASVIYAILVLKIKEVKTPPQGDELNELINDLVESQEAETSERLPNFIRDQVKLWQKVNLATYEIDLGKARNLFRAQVLLITAICAVMILTLILIIKGGGWAC